MSRINVGTTWQVGIYPLIFVASFVSGNVDLSLDKMWKITGIMCWTGKMMLENFIRMWRLKENKASFHVVVSLKGEACNKHRNVCYSRKLRTTLWNINSENVNDSINLEIDFKINFMYCCKLCNAWCSHFISLEPWSKGFDLRCGP